MSFTQLTWQVALAALCAFVVALSLTACTPMKLYTDTVKQSFDPEYHKKWRQGGTLQQKGTP